MRDPNDNTDFSNWGTEAPYTQFDTYSTSTGSW